MISSFPKQKPRKKEESVSFLKTMVIKSITVKNFHKINLFKAHFKVGVNLVNDKNVNRISTAIDFLLRADKVCIPKDWVNENTYISARILTKEKK